MFCLDSLSFYCKLLHAGLSYQDRAHGMNTEAEIRLFVIKCILKGRGMAANERSKDNEMYTSSSVGQILLHFRSAAAQVIIIGSVLLNQFGSLNAVSDV